MPEATIDLQLLQKRVADLLNEVRQTRKEVSDIRSLTLQGYELTRRVERRQAELRDDLEVAIKMELGGGLSNLQTTLEGALARIEEKFDQLADRVSAMEQKP
jgi:signal transduction histidine kinase